MAKEDVANGVVNEIASGLTRVDHEPVSELHGFGTSSAEFARHNNFATLGTRLHDKAEDTIAGT